MRALLQRVTSASVGVDGTTIGAIDQGLLILVCAMQGDSEDHSTKLAAKISKLRVFKDENGKMNRSILDIQGSALIVSQFTLAADTSRGNRPGFSGAADPETGEALYKHFIKGMEDIGITTQTGKFGADMAVSLINDGPVTLMLDM